MVKKKQAKSRKMSKQEKIDYVNAAMHRGLQQLEAGGCCIKIPQSELNSNMVSDILTAITHSILSDGKAPAGVVNWPEDKAVGELLTARVRACMQNLLDATDSLVGEMETILQWLEGIEAKTSENPDGRAKRHAKRDSKGRFTKK